jgi:uncharacterized HhH-GPD family protein
MTERLYFTDSDEANALLASDPLALLIGFVLDQQVSVQKAFIGPLVIRERVGSLDAGTLATADLDTVFREKPAVHRFPGAMASRVAELVAVVRDEYGGDAGRIWSEATDADDLRGRLAALPGFGDMKVTSLASVLSKRFGVKAADALTPDHPTLGDVTSVETLHEYQEGKRAHKAKLRSADAGI